MFSIAAINDIESGGQWEPLAPTKEAQEFHLSQTYHEGLLKLQSKDYEDARKLLEAVLKDPLVASAQVDGHVSDGHLLQLRFLALKNLATVFLQQGSLHYENALSCYLQAVEIDSKDSVVWNQLGTLSCSMGLLSTSRWAFEQGLVCSPNNWNCMEKLLEVLIAIGDEVACLSVADLILRHWPSHSRALHVKKTIEDEDSSTFAPHGIDKLQPNHVRLKFSGKRKATEDRMEEESTPKRFHQSIELCLSAATWLALASEVVGILLPASENVFQQEIDREHDTAGTEKVFKMEPNVVNGNSGLHGIHVKPGNGAYAKIAKLSDAKVIIQLSPGSEHFRDSVVGDAVCGKSSILKEREGCTDEEHPQERRSTRLERLRSRKPGKEELDSTNSKDLAKTVFQFLEPFILNRSRSKDNDQDGSSRPRPDILAYSSLHEYNDVIKFINASSTNCGAHHLGHMILEEISHKELIHQDSFIKFLYLEKLTRHWPQDRTPLCSLFLAELYYVFGIYAANESERPEFFSEASYHLCKVIELVAIDSEHHLSHIMNHVNDSNVFKELYYLNRNGLLPEHKDDARNISGASPLSVAEDPNCKESVVKNSLPDDSDVFWSRFFWMSACLSLSSGCTAKAIEEFCVCLSVLRNHKRLDGSGGCIPLPHCKHMRWLSADRVLHQINLLEIDKLLKRTTGEMIERGMYQDCIKLLAPILHSTEDAYPDLVSGTFREKGATSTELLALDVLILACERAEPMEIEMYLNSHRRKLRVLAAAAHMIISPASQKSSNENLIQKITASDMDHAETAYTHWNHMVAQEVKEVSRCASLVKTFIDKNDTYDVCNDLSCIIGDIQYLLLTIMYSFARIILGQKFSGSENLMQTDQVETQCLVDAAIAFCKLQHLDPTVPIKIQVDLIAAVHDLLADYGLCCAGKDSEGTFLKLAIKHLFALDVKLKSSLHMPNERSEAKQADDLLAVDDHENTCAIQIKSSSVTDTSTHEKEGYVSLHKNAQDKLAHECLSVHEAHDKNVGGLDSGKDATELMLHAGQNASSNVSDTNFHPIDIETEKVELGIDNALDQSFFCLYGLNIKSGQDSSSEDDLAIHRNTNRGDYQTKEQCADVFQYILPYAKISSRTGMVKLRRVLRAIRKHFLQPPDDILAQNLIDNFLDSSELCEDKLFEVAELEGNQEAIMNILYSKGSSETPKILPVMRTEPYFEVYSNLYYFIAQAEEISATDKFPGFVLDKEGEEFVEQNANLFKYDLLYNPLRFESWQKLANIYDEEVDLLLNDGSKHINIVDWGKNATLPQRVERGRRRSRRCLLASLALARTPVQQSQIHELLGLVYYDSLQNVVPLYDQRTVIPRKDAAWLNFCQKSLKHFEKAFAIKPDWIHAFYLGKLCEKMGYSSEKAFTYYNKAMVLNPSAVDPFYRMHASRLKLLHAYGRQNVDALKTVALYSFNQSAKQSVCDIFSWTSDILQVPVDIKDDSLPNDSVKRKVTIGPNRLDEAWHLLYNDCLSALEICTEGELKHYHKARYMLAQGLYKRNESGDLERAKDELSFCFKSSRSSFTINMWEIDDMVKKGRRRTPSFGGNRRILEVSLPESSRKFITCIRKYISLYLNLLEKLKDLSTLDRAYVYLRTDRRFSLCLGDLGPLALGRYIKVLTLSICYPAETLSSADTSTSLEHLLERMFHILIDHVSLWAEISSLPEVKCPELTETSLYGFIHQYFYSLESDTRLDVLEAINEKIRKRFKNPKLASPNSAKICRHASLAWCRSILVKLASITPVPDPGTPYTSASCSLEKGLLLFVDVHLDELSSLPLESSFHPNDLELKWYQPLSKIKNVCIKQASEENMETATTLLRSAYNFYRESSCATFPSGIKLYTVSSSSSQLVAEEPWQVGMHGMDILDLSIPRKLLLWAYTLVHGHYSNILLVVKYCEENTKSKMRKGSTTSSTLSHSAASTSVTQLGCRKERHVPEDRNEIEEKEQCS